MTGVLTMYLFKGCLNCYGMRGEKKGEYEEIRGRKVSV